MTKRRSDVVTLGDVAKLAGVSISTASKALNARAEVAPATRERVLRSAAELSFQPNALAKGLISGRTRTIGLLTDELAGRFSIPILLGAENALANEQMSVLLCDARGDAIRRQHYIRTLLARQVDGFIILGDSNDIRPSLTRDIPVPVVYVYCESTDPGDFSILADDEGGARLAAAHLVSLRRKHIAHITGPESYRAARDRVTGLTDVLTEHGLTLAGGAPLYGEWSQRWGRQAARMLLAGEPGGRRDLLRQRPDRDRRGRHAHRPRPDHPRRRRRGRLRQLGDLRRGLQTPADHGRPQPGAAGHDGGHPPVRRTGRADPLRRDPPAVQARRPRVHRATPLPVS